MVSVRYPTNGTMSRDFKSLIFMNKLIFIISNFCEYLLNWNTRDFSPLTKTPSPQKKGNYETDTTNHGQTETWSFSVNLRIPFLTGNIYYDKKTTSYGESYWLIAYIHRWQCTWITDSDLKTSETFYSNFCVLRHPPVPTSISENKYTFVC